MDPLPWSLPFYTPRPPETAPIPYSAFLSHAFYGLGFPAVILKLSSFMTYNLTSFPHKYKNKFKNLPSVYEIKHMTFVFLSLGYCT